MSQSEDNKIKNERFWLVTIVIAISIYAIGPDYDARGHADALQSVNPVNSTLKYENPNHTVSIEYPKSWKILTADDKRIRFVSVGLPPANFSIDASPLTAALPLIQLVATDINSYKVNLTNFRLNNSSAAAVAGNEAYKIVYSYQQGTHQLKVMRLWTFTPGKVFHIVYSSELKNYSHYLPSILKMISSLYIQSAPLVFNVEPPYSGYVECGGTVVFTGKKYPFPYPFPYNLKPGMVGVCTGEFNPGFSFSFWTADQGNTSSRQIGQLLNKTLIPSSDAGGSYSANDPRYFTAHFVKAADAIPTYILYNQYNGVALGILTGLIVPFLIPYISKRRQDANLHELVKRFPTIPRDLDYNNEEYLYMLNILWEDTFQMYAKQKINESHYKLLNDKLSVFFEELYTIKIDTLKRSSSSSSRRAAVENKGDQSDRLHNLKDQVTDAYSKQKINEAHYKMLSNRIAEYEEKLKDIKKGSGE